MKYVDEYRGPEADVLVRAIRELDPAPCRLMEICGGQTHAIVKYGIDRLLPPNVTLIHGPGCPVCVTPIEAIDTAIAIAQRPDTILCTFGDMLRVPGTQGDLFAARAHGSDIRMVYSPLDALKIAQRSTGVEVVFFAVGFETTVPAVALAVRQAQHLGLTNFSILCAHVLVPPAIEALLASPDCRVDGFLAAGHVCTVMGYEEYEHIATGYRVPIVVTGFEPIDILLGVYRCLRQLAEGRAEVENAYARVVKREGNLAAQELMEEIFEAVPRHWRGMGSLPRSGLALRARYAPFDAALRFPVATTPSLENGVCISGLVLQGARKPHECPAFGTQCTPENPLGAPMVSGEGACAAYYRYRAVEPPHPAEAEA